MKPLTLVDHGHGHTMRESISAGKYYHVHVPHWASGGWDTHAETPALAALQVGCACKELGFRTPVPDVTEVFRHLPNSRIGCTVIESCGDFPTLTHEHYDI